MSNPQYNLSPVVMSVLIEAIAEGKLHPYNLTSQVHNNAPITYNELSALFTKEDKGVYIVTLCKNDTSIGKKVCSAPIEAKATVLTYLASGAREALRRKTLGIG